MKNRKLCNVGLLIRDRLTRGGSMSQHGTKFVLFILASLPLLGCPGNKTAPPPPALAGCGPITATVTGIGVLPMTGATVDINTTATITNATTTVISWNNGGKGGGTDPISGTSGTGNVVPVPGSNPPSFTVSLTITQGGNTITITGTINTGPPCTGSGSWSSVDKNKVQNGSGSWNIP